MKRLIAILMVFALVLPMGIVSYAEDWELDDDDLEALVVLSLLEEAANSSSNSSSSSNKTSKKSKTPSVPASSVPVTAVQPYTANVKTNGGVLNIRKAANKGSTIMLKVNNGSQLTVLGYTGEWLQVSANGVTGYVPSRYVTGATGAAQAAVPVAAAAAAPVGTAVPYYAIVNPTNNYVNMRSQPNKSASVIGVYYYGYTLKVVADLGYWCQVVDENTGKQGYMLKSLLQVSYTAPADNG